jgi:hypothetical protein
MATVLSLPQRDPAAEREWLEAAALAFAQAELKQHDAGGNPWGTKGSPLSHAAGHLFMRQVLPPMAMFSVAGRLEVIALARDGVEEAEAVLRNLLLELRSRRMEVPVELAAHEMEIVHGGIGHGRQGEKKAKRLLRDIVIVMVVEGIRRVFGIDPTGRSPRWRSGCEICAEALGVVGINVGRKNVERVWAKYGANAAWLPPSLPPAAS